ncbi:hypothetical protein L226DRAFT_97287 [Lentinus tigrinus ALCF2SS1-7]|uniref:uncharacterized protein n=1 Tax=Lentinus tigrinus ALCF2SS1-7 TaxID=1328758 RepID=UPI001165E399|nr:hypothetical protein L226DRAFT_97287 [Lentinus tigrinus ALCF2SS1-7]
MPSGEAETREGCAEAEARSGGQRDGESEGGERRGGANKYRGGVKATQGRSGAALYLHAVLGFTRDKVQSVRVTGAKLQRLVFQRPLFLWRRRTQQSRSSSSRCGRYMASRESDGSSGSQRRERAALRESMLKLGCVEINMSVEGDQEQDGGYCCTEATRERRGTALRAASNIG